MAPNLSFVVRTYNSSRTLPALLGRLTRPQAEVICVDSGSSDGTLEIIKAHDARLVQIPAETFSYGRSLNVGFSMASADWVVAISSHCLPVRDDYVVQYIGLLEKVGPKVVAVAGEVVHNRTTVHLGDDLLLATSVRAARFVRHFNGNPNCAYRRSEWARNAFDEIAPFSEDHLWVQAALLRGLHVAVSFAVPVWYRNPVSLWKAYQRGLTAGQLCLEVDDRWLVDAVQNKFSLRRFLQSAAMVMGRKVGTMRRRSQIRGSQYR